MFILNSLLSYIFLRRIVRCFLVGFGIESSTPFSQVFSECSVRRQCREESKSGEEGKEPREKVERAGYSTNFKAQIMP